MAKTPSTTPTYTSCEICGLSKGSNHRFPRGTPAWVCVHKNCLSHFGNLAPFLMTHAADDRSSRKAKMHPEMVHTILVLVDLLMRQWATAHLSLIEICSSGGFLAYFSRSFVHLPPLGL